MQIKSDFAILDVLDGRKELDALVTGADGKRVPVTITGYIRGAWGNDDGTSQEFEVHVEKVEVAA